MGQDISYTYSHEHITIDLSGAKQDTDCRLDCFDDTKQELLELREKRVGRIVDVTNRGMGRNLPYLLRMERQTGVAMLCATGWYKDPFLPDEVRELPVEALAEIMLDELTNPIDGLRKASVIGEVGSSQNEITPCEQKVLTASVMAHKKTGAPIITHTTLGELGLEQIKLFDSCGADLSKIILSHVALKGDYDYIKELVSTGTNVAFDTIGKIKYQSDELRADFICHLIEDGFIDRILMSMDITRKSHLKVNGGVGYGYLLDSFLPRLFSRGVTKEMVKQIMSKNINRILEA